MDLNGGILDKSDMMDETFGVGYGLWRQHGNVSAVFIKSGSLQENGYIESVNVDCRFDD